MTAPMLHIRIEETLKAEATRTLESMGLSISDAVRVFLKRVVADRQMPFVLKAPNAESKKAIAEAESIVRTRRARFNSSDDMFNALQKKRRK